MQNRIHEMESGLDLNNFQPVDMNVSLDVEDYQTRILEEIEP